jgi:restriction system protein
MPDISNVDSKEDLKELMDKVYPGMKKMAMANEAGQIWTFLKRMKPGDLVVLPSKFTASIAIGEIKGPYQYRTDISEITNHTRPVQWIKTDIPRTAFDQDLLYSLGAFMTVCQIQRNNAEERIKKILKGKHDPGNGEGDNGDGEPTEDWDFESVATDQIIDFVNRKFKGHDLSRLVEAVLQAEGYVTENARPGPDGGVDILAGSGPMGFEEPRICVQVKSSQTPVDVTVLRGLQGAMAKFGAEQGLLVSWGGFTRAVIDEARLSYFNVRLWDSNMLIKAIFKNYDKLSDSLQAELPLKRIWALVLEEE